MAFLILLVLHLQASLGLTVSSSSSSSSIAKPNCKDHCGTVKIPYPFGIGTNCSHDASYQILCDESFDQPKPFLQDYNLEVMDITWPGRYRGTNEAQDQKLIIRIPARSICGSDGTLVQSVDFGGSPYRYSRWSNVFMVKGCSGSVVLKDRTGQILTGCASVCPNNNVGAANHSNVSNCYGDGCCLSTLLPSPTTSYLDKEGGLDYYEIFLDHEAPTSSKNTCTLVAALINSDSVEKLAGRLSLLSSFPTFSRLRYQKVVPPRTTATSYCRHE